jgi:hypothetical protein
VWSYYGWNRLIADSKPARSAQLEHIESAVEAMTGRYPTGATVRWFNDRPHRRLSSDEIKSTPWLLDETAILWDRVNADYQEMAPC